MAFTHKNAIYLVSAGHDLAFTPGDANEFLLALGLGGGITRTSRVTGCACRLRKIMSQIANFGCESLVVVVVVVVIVVVVAAVVVMVMVDFVVVVNFMFFCCISLPPGRHESWPRMCRHRKA